MAKLKITLVKSVNKAKKKQVANVIALGLGKKIGKVVEHNDSPQTMGMIKVVSHLIKVENV